MNDINTITGIFESLSDENRVRIVNLLLLCPRLCVADLEFVLKIPQTRVSRHLGYLRARKITEPKREGTFMYYSLNGEVFSQPGLRSTLQSLFGKVPKLLSDVERLLEGIDGNQIAALRSADPDLVEDIIRNCCEIGQ
jgi:ArsR family transcriptional regulator, arsenate/arsenite/antimonite-responsive transcriptional repressor